MQKDQRVIGIDIGGTKISIGLVQDGQVINLVKISTSAQAQTEQIIFEIIHGIKKLGVEDFAGIGVGVPGVVDEENGIVYDVQNIPAWKEVHLKQSLESYFKKPVYLSNDANCFVLGEKVFGKGKSYKSIVGLSLGTGLGAGLVLNGRLYSGLFSGAGEFGCIPYLDKTFEDYCSGKFFKSYGTTGAEAYELAKKDDEKALEIMNGFGFHLGKALHIIMYTLSPEAIFLGGSINIAFPYFKESMFKVIREFPFKKVTDNILIEPTEIKNAPVLGAAALFQMQSESINLQKKIIYA